MKFAYVVAAASALILFSCQRSAYIDCDPKLVTINFIDQHGVSETISNEDRLEQYTKVDFLSPQPYRKVLRVYQRDGQGNILAYITSYHPNGQIHQYLEIINGRAYGTYRAWYDNGVCKIDANLIGGAADLSIGDEKSWIFEGLCRAWDEAGSLQAEFVYEKGELEGLALYYHPKGKLWKKLPFCRGKLEGIEEVYLDNGAILQTTTYTQGQKEGAAKRYWRDGTVAADEIYCRGKLMQGVYFDSCGEKISDICQGVGFKAIFTKGGLSEMQEYRAGVQEGCVKVFDNMEALAKIYYMKNGLKQGEEIIFYPNSDKALLVINWSQGKIHGLAKTFYPNGTQESQREMAGNKKNGLLTSWYIDGNLMLIEEYDHDKLVKGEYYKRGDRFPVSTVLDGKGMAKLFDSDGVFLRKVQYRSGRPES